jgi:hypothetical protein
MRVHILVTQGGAVQEPEGTVLEVRMGAHNGFGLNEGPPNFAVLEAEVPGGDEVIAEEWKGNRYDPVEGIRRPRFRLDVPNLPEQAKADIRRPGPSAIAWATLKAKMKDLE